MIYLASPYSHSDESIRVARFDAACRYAADLMRRGEIVFSPIAHSHPLVRFGLPTGWDFWHQFDRVFLSACSEVVVLMLEGWEQSAGIKAELEIAKELGKPIRFVGLETSATT